MAMQSQKVAPGLDNSRVDPSSSLECEEVGQVQRLRSNLEDWNGGGRMVTA